MTEVSGQETEAEVKLRLTKKIVDQKMENVELIEGGSGNSEVGKKDLKHFLSLFKISEFIKH